MFEQHKSSATIDKDGIIQALKLLCKEKGITWDIEIEKFIYKKGTIKFIYSMVKPPVPPAPPADTTPLKTEDM